MPQRDNRSKENQGYEIYEDLWKHVARAVYENTNIYPICIQSLFVKYKKGKLMKLRSFIPFVISLYLTLK